MNFAVKITCLPKKIPISCFSMQEKVIQFPLNSTQYLSLAEKLNQEGKHLDALGFLFTAYKYNPKDYKIISEIADTYADMGLSDYSNKFWFKYLDVAPESKASVAYEELGINYFYLDNLWASSYYFHLKVSTDGYISRDTLSEDIIEFLNERLDKRSLYHIAYPFDRADFSVKVKAGKRAFSAGDFRSSNKILQSIPSECIDEDASGDLTVGYLMCKQEEKAIEACKESLRVHGENVTAYCNLSTIYYTLDDKEKSKYYYKKALSLRRKDKDDEYKLLSCAIGQNDYFIAKDCVSVILKDRENDSMMWFILGVANANLFNFEGAVKAFKTAYRINPDDEISFFYANRLERLIEDGRNADKILPISFEKEYPKNIVRNNKKFLKEIKIEDASDIIKSGKNREKLLWGVKFGDEKTVQKCCAIICLSEHRPSEKILLNLLLDPEFPEEKKRRIVFTLLVCGRKSKFGIVCDNCYLPIKTRKTLFSNENDGMIFNTAYALTVSKAVFIGIDDVEKIVFKANKIYKKYGKIILAGNYTVEDISSLIIYHCNFKRFEDLKTVCTAFGGDYKKLIDLSMVLKGE